MFLPSEVDKIVSEADIPADIPEDHHVILVGTVNTEGSKVVLALRKDNFQLLGAWKHNFKTNNDEIGAKFIGSL